MTTTPATRALGRRAPSRKPALRLALTPAAATITHPGAVDHLHRPGLTFGLYQNDQWGVCGPTALANTVRLVTAWLGGGMVVPTQADVFDLYRRSGNPGFDPATGADDNGVDMQTMLEAAVAGGIGGRKPLAFAQLDHTNLDAIRAATAIFGSVLLGVDLQEAQNEQTDTGAWDYHPSPEWGGHAILGGEYKDPAGTTSDRLGVITWQQVVECSDRFLTHQLSEAWVAIMPEHLGTARFQEGVDLAAMATQWQALTHRPWPLTPPAPASPAPTADVQAEMLTAVQAWLASPPNARPDNLLAVVARRWLAAQH